MKDNCQTDRLLLAILAVVVGLFMISVAPFLIQASLEHVLVELAIIGLYFVVLHPKFTSALICGEQ